MDLSPLDHAIAVALLVVLPLFGKRNFLRFRQAIATGGPDARVLQYRKIIVRQWVLAIGVVVFWLLGGRPLAGLGLALPFGLPGLAGLTISLFVVGALHRQVRTVRGLRDEELAAHGSKIGEVAELLPHTDRETAVFRGVAVTAGICEEIVYRGFLIAYLAVFMSVWFAAVLGGIGFGLAHAYQGTSGILKTGATGTVNGLLYVATGSLVWPMLLHSALDLHGGAVGRRVLDATRRHVGVSALDGAP
jgi:membrane protease YdiL (CAAX protease family)